MTPSRYGEIEIGLHRSQPETYDVELRVTDPGTDAEVAAARGRARISLGELARLCDLPDDYGALLADAVFSDQTIREFWLKNKVSFESRGLMLRLRVLIGPSVPELHGLRWELLSDPETKLPLATSERVLFSRFMLSRDWRVVKLRPKAKLKGLIAVAAPSDIVSWRMAEVDYAGETARVREGLTGIDAPALDRPVTLDRLIEGLRQGIDILYLVCHGALPKGEEPCLYLQNDEGKTDIVLASALARRIQELQEAPRLIVLASCESAGTGDGRSAQAALAPRLAEAGVPAVLAMQDRISIETVKRAMPVFFRELLKDGQIDRAMAVARGAVHDQPDHWVPALFLRLKSGRIWYEPGFGGEGGNDDVPWDSVCRSVIKGDLVPILGPDLAEHIYGSSRSLAADLARVNDLALSPYERPDAAKVAQRITTKSGYSQLRDQILDILHTKLLEKAKAVLTPPPPGDLSPPELMSLLADELMKDPDQPLRILSELNLKVYVNGAADPLLKLFLKRSGKRPTELFSDWRTECIVDEPRLHQAADALCNALGNAAGESISDIFNRWRDGLLREGEPALPVSLESAADRLEEMLQDQPSTPAPNIAEAWRDAIRKPPTDTPSKPLPNETPLIYYVFGRSKYNNTWVLTEDDFFDYLIRATSYKLMPGIVADKLVAGSLLFLGFPLDDWKFRILFRMIMSKDGKGLLRSENYYHVGVQVDPEEHTPEEASRIRKFLETYFGRAANVNIFWGSAADFLKGLRDHLKDPKFRTQAPKAAAARRSW